MRRKKRRREGDEAKGWIAGWFGTRKGVEVEGMATGRCPKTRFCYCPPTPFSVAPNSDFDTCTHRHTHTRPRIPPTHPLLPPAHQAGTNLCTHATPRIHDRTRENRRMHVSSDAVTRTRNMHTQCPRVVSTLPFG